MINRSTPVWMNHEASAEKFRFEIWKLLFIGIDDHWWDIDGWLFELIYGIDGLDATPKREAAFKKSITRFRAMLPSFHCHCFLHQRAIVQFGQSVRVLPSSIRVTKVLPTSIHSIATPWLLDIMDGKTIGLIRKHPTTPPTSSPTRFDFVNFSDQGSNSTELSQK